VRNGGASGGEYDFFPASQQPAPTQWNEKERNVQRMLDELQKRQEGLRKRESALAEVRDQMEEMAYEMMGDRKRTRRN